MTLESLAVALAVLYLILAVRQNIWCWAAALVSTALYLHIFYAARLYMEAALQVFYIAMAVYGWHQWRRGDAGSPRRVTTWPLRAHALSIGAIATMSLASGTVLLRFTDAEFPFLDSLTTWGGIVATYMVARKVLENWHYWFVIDSLSIYLYVNRGLHQTAWLFVLYLVLIVVGYLSWRRDLTGRRVPGEARA